MARGSLPSGRNRQGLSTGAERAGGPARSSCEGPVMGPEPRGGVVRDGVRSINRAAKAGEESRGRVEVAWQAVRDFEVGGLGGLPAGEEESGRRRGGRGVHRRLRGRS